MQDIAIRTKALTRDFGAVRAVSDLTLNVPRGIVFGFLGPNGAGKTTTIRLLLGLLDPTAGCAEVLGFDTRSQSDAIRERTGALLEHHGLYERLSAYNNLDFYGRIWHLPKGERETRIKELLTHLGLWERRRERAGTWSKGMKQKLAVARVLLHRPTLIFLDEPTSGLDPVAAAALREDIAGLAAHEGTTVFLNTHNLTEAEKLCALVGVIREGKLVTVGNPDALRASTGAPYVEVYGRGFTQDVLASLRAYPEISDAQVQNSHLRIVLAQPMDNAPLVRMLVNAGVEVEEVRKGKSSLEEVFLTLMEEQS
jgi:ABC-2 type transport system ATP-binding protein